MKKAQASPARPRALARWVRYSLSLGLLVTLAACGGSKESRIASGLAKGAEFVRQGELDKANIEVRNVLQIDPKNAAAFLVSAQVSEAQRDIQRAFGAYSKALELQPDLLDAQVGLARIFLLAGDIPRAEQKVNEALAVDATHPQARTLRAALLVAGGKTSEAQKLLRQVLAEGDRAPADASLVLAGMHARAREWPQALAVIEAGLQRDPMHQGLLHAAVEVVSAQGQDGALASKAVGYFERATAAAPRDDQLWLAWTRYHLGRKEPDPAEAVLRAAIQADPDDPQRRLALLDFLLTVRGVPVAEKAYRSFIADKPRDMSLRFGLASLYRTTSRPAEAQAVLAEIVKLSNDSSATLAAQTQLAAYRLATGQQDEARKLLAQVLQANPRDNAALVLNARLHLMAGNPKDAVADLRAALRDQPGSLEVVQLLAQALRVAGQTQLAREAVADASKAQPNSPDLRALVAADLADGGDFKSAHAELDSAIKALPQATRLYELKARLAQSQKNFVLAERTLQQLKARQPGEATAYVRLGQLHMAQGKFSLALKEFDAGAAAAPGDVTPYVAAVSLLTGLKRADEALARVRARTLADPTNAVLHLQLGGEVALARGDAAGAETAFRAIITKAPVLPTGYVNLARVLGNRGEVDGALRVLSEGEKLQPADLTLPLARADWLTRLKRYDEAIALYEELRLRHPEDDTVLNNLAYLLAEVKGDAASIERALALAGRLALSRNPSHLDSLGWIHYRLGQYEKAVPLLEQALALSTGSPLLQLHLGKALVKAGDQSRGRELIRRAIASKAVLPRIEEARTLLDQG